MFRFFGKRRHQLECQVVCDRGLQRQENQDAVFVDAAGGLFCLADGMGGGSAGGEASRLVCDAVSKVRDVHDFAGRVAAAADAVGSADRAIRGRAREQGFAQMGSTLAALFIDPTDLNRVSLLWAGDSRVYLRRARKFAAMTKDHRSSAYSHLLTRAIGAGTTGEPERLDTTTRRGDIWILCTDGVHEMVTDDTMNAICASSSSAAEIVSRIERNVRSAGARDNYSLIAVRV